MTLVWRPVWFGSDRVLVYFTIGLMVLLGFVGLAVDVGRMELRTIQLQAAADDGAVTAASEWQRANYTFVNTATEVSAFAVANGIGAITTAGQQTSGKGAYVNDYSALQVTASQQFPLYFLGLVLGTSSTALKATAVSVVPPCSFFLNATSISLWLASTAFSTNCPVYANYGITNDYFSSFNTMQSKIAGPASQSPDAGGSATHPTIYNAPVLADPLAYITAPVFSSCTVVGGILVGGTMVVYPGTYCGGISISNSTVTLMPGLYIITGGMTVTNSTLTGSGVTMYFTKGGGSGYGSVTFNGNSVIHLNAPTDSSGGGVPGLTLFGDRSWTGTTTDFHFNGCTWLGDGIIYLPNTGMSDQYCNLHGTRYFGIVTQFMYEYQSDVHPLSDYSALVNGNPFHVAATLVQ